MPEESSHQPHLLAVEDLHVHYGAVCALEGITLQRTCGSCTALLGRNGAGKSTLLKAIAGLLPIAAGRVTWCGQPLAQARHEIGYLPQREDVDWNFPITVRGLVEMGRYSHIGWLRRFSQADHLAVDEALEAMGLGPLQKRQISELSGGQQQRAFIARAIAQKAHILLFDEPFAGLDEATQQTFGVLLKELARSGHLVLASHHDLKTVASVFDDAVLLDRTLLADGPAAEVVAMIRKL